MDKTNKMEGEGFHQLLFEKKLEGLTQLRCVSGISTSSQKQFDEGPGNSSISSGYISVFSNKILDKN